MRIGTTSGKPCRISAGSPNQSVCITGLSGTGKTVRLNQLELESIRQHCAVLVIDTSQTHTETGIFEPLRNEFLRYANYLNVFDGLGLDIFQTLETPQGQREPFVQAVNSVVQALSSGYRMGVGQLGVLREAVVDVVQHGGSYGDDAEALKFALKAKNDDRAEAVYQKLWTLIHCGALKPSRRQLQSGKINVLDLSGMDQITQNSLVGIILHTLWRRIRFWGLPKGQKKLTLVLDEFQNLPLKKDSVLCDMLREGRKFGLNFLLATQSLKSLPREIEPLIGQTATRLYFRPSPSEVGNIARKIDASKTSVWSQILLNLNVGECLAVGEFEVEGREVKRPLILG